MTGVVDYLTVRLPALLAVVRDSDVRELDLEEGDTRLYLRRSRTPAAPQTFLEQSSDAPPIPGAPPMHEVTAPLVGTFYRAHQEGMAPLVTEGSEVDENTVVGIVEALQVLTEVEAGCRGTVVDVRAHDGQPVEYGQILFGIRPHG